MYVCMYVYTPAHMLGFRMLGKRHHKPSPVEIGCLGRVLGRAVFILADRCMRFKSARQALDDRQNQDVVEGP